MTQYDFAKQFCSDDGMRHQLQTPWIISRNGVRMVAASNGYSLITFPETDGSTTEDSKSIESMFVKVMDKNPLFETPKIIKVSELVHAIQQLPLIPEMDGNEVECPDCDGEGTVECECCGHEHDCDRCDGEGVIEKEKPTGQMIPDMSKCARIENAAYMGARIEEILKAVKYANVEEIAIIRSGGQYESTTFQIANIEMLVMPTSNSQDDIVYTIQCNN